MKLRSKFLKWNAGLPVAMLNKETAIELGVKAQEMILIKTLSKHPKEMTAVLDIIDGEFGKKQILLSLEVKSKMNLKKGQIVDINIAPIPRSVDLIRKKLNNKRLARNRTTPIVVSICAAAGLKFPKTSSRAITSAAGTADVMETIVKVGFPIPELKKILKKTNAFIVWGGGMGTVPADSKIIKVERELKIDPKSQLLASIMSKKFAVGSKYILIDIPYGKTAKMPTRKKPKSLARKFLQLGIYFHKKMKVVLTDGSQPVGNGIGPALELMDIIKIL